jgi:hypothetical protein
MARYNTVVAANSSISSTTSLSSPGQGLFTELTGTAPYTVTLPTPVLYTGIQQAYYNATSGSITLTSPSGIWIGNGSSGTASQVVLSNTTVIFVSDGTNYVILAAAGGAGVFTTLTASSTVTFSPVSATVTISPTGTGANVSINPAGTLSLASTGVMTINPAAASTMDNVVIGGTTALAGSFTNASASNAPSLAAHLTRKDYVDVQRASAFFYGMGH